MVSRAFIEGMPKVELHVHLEGAICPETVLKLAKKNSVSLPADTVEGLREWYQFRDFPHFVDVYVSVTKTIKTADDVELIAREFLEGQAAQHVLYTEATYTAATVQEMVGIPWEDQFRALQRAREYAARELGTHAGWVIDIVRGHSPERALEVAEWAVRGREYGVVALGLAGEERRGGAPEYRQAFDHARDHGLPIIPHAGETQGPWSIIESMDVIHPTRLAHGVRAIEDPALVARLRQNGVVLDVCPSSNVCLNVVPDLPSHMLPQLVDAGLRVTINSDDPPMFGTTLTEEFVRVTEAFGFTREHLRAFTDTAVEAALVDSATRDEFAGKVADFFGTR